MKPLKANKSSLSRRLLTILLPVTLVPLLLFGVYAIWSHYNSLTSQHIKGNMDLLRFMSTELETLVDQSLDTIEKLSADEVLRTDNLFLIREQMKVWHASGINIRELRLLSVDNETIATEPPRPSEQGKRLKNPWKESSRPGIFYSPFDENTDSDKFINIRVKKLVRGLEGIPNKYIMAEIDLSAWSKNVREIREQRLGAVGALLPKEKFGDVIVRGVSKLSFDLSKSLLTAQVHKKPVYPITLDDERYLGFSQDLPSYPFSIAVYIPYNSIYAAPRRVLMWSVVALFALLCITSIVVVLLAKSITKPISEIAEAVTEFSDSEKQVKVELERDDEIGLLADSFNNMATSIRIQHVKMRVLYQSIRELFNCKDLDSIFQKAIQLACVQVEADLAWFVPAKNSRWFGRGNEGLHGWVWIDGKIRPVSPRDSTGLWQRKGGDRLYNFIMRYRNEELGTIRVAYQDQPTDHFESLLHTLIGIVEMAIEKQHVIRDNTLINAELEIAESVQRNLLSERLLDSKRARLAYHYQPANRLGGDWFYIIDDEKRDQIHVIMGDVTGHGLPQGLVTTAVKGALDMIEILIRSTDRDIINGPAEIMSFLDSVVRRSLGKNKMLMTCVAATVDFRKSTLNVCNAGHTFPIHIHHDNGLSWAQHLMKNQQPVIGTVHEPSFRFEQTSYKLDPGDLIVLYTDGLSEAKNLDSRVFGRFLFRRLRQRRDFTLAEDLRDEILEMFKYYTQGSEIEDDVCFLVLQMQPENYFSASKGIKPA